MEGCDTYQYVESLFDSRRGSMSFTCLSFCKLLQENPINHEEIPRKSKATDCRATAIAGRQGDCRLISSMFDISPPADRPVTSRPATSRSATEGPSVYSFTLQQFSIATIVF